MFRRLLVAAALAAGVSGAALAQDLSWDQNVNDAFVNPATGTLRSGDEIHANWQTLSQEEQAQVRADCELTTASVDPNAADKPAEQETAMAQVCNLVDSM